MPKSIPAASTPWRLALVMQVRKIRSVVELHRLMLKHVPLSYDRARRLVAGELRELPSFEIIDALCRVLACNPDDLIGIAHRSTKVAFEPTLPKARAWKPREFPVSHVRTPRQRPLTDVSLPVDIYDDE